MRNSSVARSGAARYGRAMHHRSTTHRLEPRRRLRARALTASPRRVIVEADEPALVVGHHSFRPVDVPDVLTPGQAAALLQVDEDAVLALAEAGRLPGRRIGDEWRFARTALVAWLSGTGDADG